MRKSAALFILILISFLVQSQGIYKDLYVFDFNLNKMSIQERTTNIYELGFKGITFSVNSEERLNTLTEYLETEEVSSGKLSMPIV